MCLKKNFAIANEVADRSEVCESFISICERNDSQ